MKRLVANQETINLFVEATGEKSWGWVYSKTIETFANKVKDTTTDTIEQYNPTPEALIQHLTTLTEEADEIAAEVNRVLDNVKRLRTEA